MSGNSGVKIHDWPSRNSLSDGQTVTRESPVEDDCLVTETTPFIGGEDVANSQNENSISCLMVALTIFAALGGFLFGYDTGVISGALLPLTRQFNLDDLWKELIVSATVGAAIFGAVSGGWFNDKFGRKLVLIGSSLVFGIGAVVMAAAPGKETLLIGRIIVGVAIGYASTTVPMYVAETAPAAVRGKLITVYQLFITFGQFVASVVDGLFASDKVHGWRYMLGIGGIPAIVMMLGMLFMPESPRYLVNKGKVLQAERVLSRLRGIKGVKEELNRIILSCQKDESHASDNIFSSFKRAMTTSYTRRAIVVGCGLQAFQQLCGINTVMYYSATILSLAGMGEKDAIWLAAVVACGNFVFSFIALFLIEKAGRLKLTLVSLFGVIVALCLLAATFVLLKDESPKTAIRHFGDQCGQLLSCYDCLIDESCGFCYFDAGNRKYLNSSCIKFDKKGSRPSLCNSTALHWTKTSCPTSYAWLAVLSMILYLAAFAPGMGPMPWAINAEIYPLWARSIGTSSSTATNWFFNLLVSITFLHVIQLLSRPGAFVFYACLAAVGWVFIFLLLPETKGKSLEDIEDLFKENVIVRCRKKPTEN